MTKEQAKEILSAYRPGTDDENDPVFSEALELSRTDAELKAWFAESTGFDRIMKAHLARIIAPAGVRDAILAEHKIIRPVPWWSHRLTRRQWAAAAAVAMTGALVALWFGNRPARFAEFRRDIADQAWGATPHVEIKASNLVEVRRFLHEQKLPSQFPLPPTLAQSEVRGCSLVHWRGHEVPMICFNSERQHLHLIVVDKSLFPDAPSGVPQMDEWEAWRTASWSKDGFSYVLTGLNTPNFVKKFRKSKRWDWEG